MLKKFWVCIFLVCTAKSLAQDANSSLEKEITLQLTNASIQSSLKQLVKVSGLSLSYNSKILPKKRKLNQTFRNEKAINVLNYILSEANLYFRKLNGTIILQKNVFSERVISGKVIDANTGAPLPFANVFIENTTLGDGADADGLFLIDDVPNIRFNLVTSYVGYKSKTIPFTYDNNLDEVSVTIELEIDPIALETINVYGRASNRKKIRNRRRLLSRFQREFLGRSENSKDCRIVNPEVLNFEILDSLENYSVTAEDIVYIENRALGYRIAYLLEEFRFENGMKMDIGKAQFRELETKSRKRYSKWEVERERAYYGSQQHFLNALINNELQNEGYQLNVINFDSVTSEYTTPLNPPIMNEIIELSETEEKSIFNLTVKSDLEITYKKEYEESDYKKQFRSSSKSGNYKYTDKKVRSSIVLNDQASLTSYQVFGADITDVDLFQKSVIFFNQKNTTIASPGQFLNLRDVVFSGWWSWTAISDRLPVDYLPN